MRRNGRRDQRIVVEPRQVLLGEGEHRLLCLVVRGREAEERFAQHAAHAGGARFFRHDVLIEVHIGVSGGAGQQHFQAGQARAPADEVGIDVAPLGRENEVLQPVLQVLVVGDTAHECHRRVLMGVDKARHQYGIGMVFPRLRLIRFVDFRARSDGDNLIRAYGDGTVFDHAAGGVHRDDIVRGPCYIYGLGGDRRNGSQQ